MPPRPEIADIFASALELETGGRHRFVKAECNGDNVLFREVEQLLAEHDEAEAENFLSNSAVEIEAEHLADDEYDDRRIGQRFGHYQILKRLGAGGMGAIYLASRTDDFDKLAAVKIIKRGMDTDAILTRFRNERQILANLEHPNIARLLDGGTTSDGLPFFAMEYVEGVSISEFCRDLGEREILVLFRKVCSAVSFAHQKLIVHRDLKPSNILVNADGEPKLLDFGIAKLLDQTDNSETHALQRILTPAYASPEHISGAIVGTSSDVFSLGRILTELLMGADNDFGSQNSGSNGSGIRFPAASKLDVDLQNILSMATRTEPRLRYSSVERFSDDIRRYLENLPVSARKISYSYRGQKFIQRNKAKTVLAALLVLSFAGGLAATLLKANEARRERMLAEKRFDNLRKLSDSFVTEIHAAIRNLPGSLPARQLLLKRATEQLDALANESENNRQLQAELANAYFNLASLPDMGISDQERVFLKVKGIYEMLLADDPKNSVFIDLLAATGIELAELAKVQGSVGDALKYSESAVSLMENGGDVRTDDGSRLLVRRNAWASLANFYSLAGDADRSLAAGRRTLEISEQMQQPGASAQSNTMLVGRARQQIAAALIQSGDYKSAISELQIALDVQTKARERSPNDTSLDYYLWITNRRLAIATELDGDRKAALGFAETALALIDGLLATSANDKGYSRNSAITNITIGQMLVRQNQPHLALRYFVRARTLSENLLKLDPDYFESKVDVAEANGNLGHAQWLSGQQDEGLRNLRQSAAAIDNFAHIDSENAVLKRDYAETTLWLAAALYPSRKEEATAFHNLSQRLWNELRTDGKLNAADIELAELP